MAGRGSVKLKKTSQELILVWVLLVALLGALPLAGQSLDYPPTRKGDQVDDYHGIKVADPYRWLEDDNSAETAKWVEAENKVTFAYLDKIPYRAQVKKRLEELYNYARYTAPFRKGDLYFFTKNDGLQNQNVVYVRKGLDGAPEVLLDPNKFPRTARRAWEASQCLGTDVTQHTGGRRVGRTGRNFACWT